MREAYLAKQSRLKRKQYNERLKLLIVALNAIAMAILVSVFIFPVVRLSNIAVFNSILTWFWLIVSVIIHLYAQYLLGFLKSEE